MLSIGNGLQLAFADENDRYFTDSLLRLTLHQYLWFHLRERYDAVCFLNESDDGKGFSIRTFGDCDKMLPNDWLHGVQQTLSSAGKAQKIFHKWMKCKTAIVCPARDFCKVMSQENWKECFEKTGKLINSPSCSGVLMLTASCYVEDNTDWLCEASILAREDFCVALHKTIFNHETYEYLQQSMGDHCTFLSVYSMETIYPIVLRAAMAKPKRLEHVNSLERIASYFIGSTRQRGLGNVGKRITFEELYRSLLHDDYWDKLLNDSTNSPGIPIGGASMFHVAHSYAIKCLGLPSSKAIEEDSDALKAANHIHSVVCDPHCCAENQSIVTALETLLDCALHQFKAEDWQTYKICIQAIDFAISHVYDFQIDIIRNVNDIIDSYKTYIHLSTAYGQTLKLEPKDFARSPLGQAAYERLKLNIETTKTQMEQCRGAILAMTVKLSTAKMSDIPNRLPDIVNSALEELAEEKPDAFDPCDSEYTIRESDFHF